MADLELLMPGSPQYKQPHDQNIQYESCFQCHHYLLCCVSRVYNTHLSAVDSATRSSNVSVSPEEKKLSASEHGRVDRVLFVSSAWSQLRGTWSLQNVASRVAFAASAPDVRSLLLATSAGYRVILSFPPVRSLLRYAIGPLAEWGTLQQQVQFRTF